VVEAEKARLCDIIAAAIKDEKAGAEFYSNILNMFDKPEAGLGAEDKENVKKFIREIIADERHRAFFRKLNEVVCGG